MHHKDTLSRHKRLHTQLLSQQAAASSAKWQTGCWVHFHHSEALIPLPSLLFIFCFASSISRAFEIFPLWWSLSFHPELVRRDQGGWKRRAYSHCLHPLILPTFLHSSPPSVCHPSSSPMFFPYSRFIPPSFLLDLSEGEGGLWDESQIPWQVFRREHLFVDVRWAALVPYLATTQHCILSKSTHPTWATSPSNGTAIRIITEFVVVKYNK